MSTAARSILLSVTLLAAGALTYRMCDHEKRGPIDPSERGGVASLSAADEYGRAALVPAESSAQRQQVIERPAELPAEVAPSPAPEPTPTPRPTAEARRSAPRKRSETVARAVPRSERVAREQSNKVARRKRAVTPRMESGIEARAGRVRPAPYSAERGRPMPVKARKVIPPSIKARPAEGPLRTKN
jgi:hypothetical protein